MEIASKLTSNVLKFISYPESTFTYNNRFSHGRTTLHCCSATRKLEIRSPPNRPLRKHIQPITPHRPKPITTTTSEVLRLMDSLGLGIPLDIYVSLIKECTQDRDPARAVELHAHFNRSGIRPCLGLLNRLLIMYVSCGCIEYARQLFDEMPVRDCNSWAAIIAGYADNGDYGEAIEFFVLFLRRRHYDFISVVAFPVSWILVCVLDACVHTFDLEVGKQIHGWLLKSGYLSDLFLSSSLINFYGKVGWSEGADLVFDQITRRNVVVWTARIVNKCKEERFDEVLSVFKEMGKEGVKKNSFTFSSVLRACAKMSDVTHCGEQVHANAIKLGLVSKCYVQSGLVNMYGKFGLIRDAKKAFEMNGRRRNNACWNAMLTAYIHNGFYIEAVKFLYQMKAAGVEPQELLLNEVSYSVPRQTSKIRVQILSFTLLEWCKNQQENVESLDEVYDGLMSAYRISPGEKEKRRKVSQIDYYPGSMKKWTNSLNYCESLRKFKQDMQAKSIHNGECYEQYSRIHFRVFYHPCYPQWTPKPTPNL